MHVSPQTTNAEPQWSRASSAFLQEYPWDDVILLHDEASAIRDAFQADVPSITRQEVVKKDWQFERVEDSERQQAAGEHYLQPLIRALLRFERTEVHSPYGQTHAGTIRRFILQTKVELQGLTLPEGPPSSALLHAPDGIALSIPKMDMLSRYVALMRVIDVGSTLEGRRRHRTIPKWGGNWQPANNPALAFIHDMKALLMKAKNALQNVLSPFDDSAGSQTTTTAEGTPPPPVPALCESSLHLSWLLAGHVDIPETFSNGTLELQGLTEIEKSELGRLLAEKDSAYRIRLPLLYSLLVSPLVLLRTVSVRKQSMKRVHLITAAIYNGNVKPPIIAMMEKMVFAVVFGIARGTTSIKDGIDSLLNDLPWDCVATLPPEVVSWFVLAPPLGVSSAANSPLHPRSSRDAAAFEPSSLPPISLEASRIASQGSSSNTSLATTSNFQPSLTPAHPSVDIHGLGILQGFAEFVQSAATSTNITSAFSQEVLAVVALGALGIVLDEAAVQQLVQQRHQPRTISGSAVVTFPSVSPGEVEFVPAADEPVHNSVSELILGNQPAVLPPPIGPGDAEHAPIHQPPSQASSPQISGNPSKSNTDSRNPDVETSPISRLHSEPTSPTLSQVFRDFDNLEPLQPFAESPHPDEELDSQPEANGIDKEQDSWSETDIIDEELDIRSEANSIEEEMDIRSEANSIEEEMDIRSEANSSDEDMDIRSEANGSDEEMDNQSEADSIDGELAKLFSSDPETLSDPAAVFDDDILTTDESLEAGRVEDGDPPGEDMQSPPLMPPRKLRPPNRNPLCLDRELAPRTSPSAKKQRRETPPGGVHLRAADMSQVGNTPDTAIDDTVRRLPPRTSDRLKVSMAEKICPSGMEKGKVFYGPDSKHFRWVPWFYNKSDAEGFVHWASAIQGCFVKDLPRHISMPESSAFLVTSEVGYQRMSVRQRRSVFGEQGKLAIVLTDCTYGRPVMFDKAGLETLTGRMDADIEVQDQSQPLRNNQNIMKARARLTTLQDIMEYSKLPLANRPIINGLTFPLPPGLRPEQEFTFSSEHIAWLRTLGNHFCFAPYPTSSTRWSLVAFNGALHYYHIDSDGFGTWVEVRRGRKLWVIARPKDESIPSFGDIHGFLQSFGDGKLPNEDIWIIEAMVLGPNT
ncbi:hypothetical protein BKA70DRAFT_1451693 [Coprinopsis sp. MPI-PUGE-AT-0042]|nr:hypothetical protein BKA70DRAFT_1451693 [Coprinopsis sp. MPI-PUGE-AT-0042]